MQFRNTTKFIDDRFNINEIEEFSKLFDITKKFHSGKWKAIEETNVLDLG